MDYRFKKVTVITGEYGCGKTNLAVNVVRDLSSKYTTAAVDLDIVNPYFRTADFRRSQILKNADLICPEFAGSNLDIPVLNFDPERIIREHERTVIDLGGSDAGAFALGRYRNILRKYTEHMDFIYVFNMYRSLSPSPEEALISIRSVEEAASLRCTALVNNSNLGPETTLKTVTDSFDFADKLSSVSGLKTIFTCIPFGNKTSSLNKTGSFYPVTREVRMIWENDNFTGEL